MLALRRFTGRPGGKYFATLKSKMIEAVVDIALQNDKKHFKFDFLMRTL